MQESSKLEPALLISNPVLISASTMQHASGDVERMILGNKCDVEEERQVSKAKGDQVRPGTNCHGDVF